jgi:hypothetical protein
MLSAALAATATRCVCEGTGYGTATLPDRSSLAAARCRQRACVEHPVAMSRRGRTRRNSVLARLQPISVSHQDVPMLSFAITVFLSAFLLFQVQPIIAKMILPWFGGSSSVWSTCLVFFQAELLLGYLYVHLLHELLVAAPPEHRPLRAAAAESGDAAGDCRPDIERCWRLRTRPGTCWSSSPQPSACPICCCRPPVR